VIHAIPTVPGEISPGWLTSALRGAGAITASSVTGCRPTVIGEDWGFTGIVSRVELDYDQPEQGAPATVIAKFPNAAGETLSAFRTNQQRDPELARRYLHRCAREIWFYQQVATRRHVASPVMYYGVADMDAGHFVLLLEDLSALRSGDAVAGCSPAAAQAVLDAIAPVHGGWWAQDDDSSLSWIPRWPEDPAGRVRLYQSRVEPFLSGYGERIPTRARAVVERLADSLPDVLDALAAAPRTIGHADLHLDNVLFDADGSVTIIDWQTVLWIPAACDLAAFLMDALDPAARREHEPGLLRHYHQAILACGVEDYSFDALQHHYRLAMLNVIAGIVGWLGNARPESLAGRELALLEAAIEPGRIFHAVADHDLSSLL
jgi:aminoglycoside/choline kinase family phosphotransferase